MWEDWDGVHNTDNEMKTKAILLKTAGDTTIVITSSIHCNVILEKISATMQAKKVNFGKERQENNGLHEPTYNRNFDQLRK